MKLADRKSGLFWCRAILFVGTLLCLCISDSAGLRLLPLPDPGLRLAFSALPHESESCDSRIPSPNKAPKTYLQMVAGSQYRARDRHYHVQPATHAPVAFCQLQPSSLTTTPETYAPLSLGTPSLSIPTGRAPPRFA